MPYHDDPIYVLKKTWTMKTVLLPDQLFIKTIDLELHDLIAKIVCLEMVKWKGMKIKGEDKIR